MYPIPKPVLLNPDRVIADERDTMSEPDYRTKADKLQSELSETCAYAQELWDQLESVRHYLVESLPHPPPSWEVPLGGARPTGRDDERGWQQWQAVYAAVLTAMTGPHGDSGFAEDEAREIVRARLEFLAGQEPTIETIRGRPHR
ncbi:MAG TPA: hypothetical protein VKB75_03745 [Jatrophihabitans sp.]|nr:hypothetical protein [Jatrophihabitans sp.]